MLHKARVLKEPTKEERNGSNKIVIVVAKQGEPTHSSAAKGEMKGGWAESNDRTMTFAAAAKQAFRLDQKRATVVFGLGVRVRAGWWPDARTLAKHLH